MGWSWSVSLQINNKKVKEYIFKCLSNICRLRLLWLTMTNFYSRCEIEYLPVYNPSEEEQANPSLYAKNVRDVMAK